MEPVPMGIFGPDDRIDPSIYSQRGHTTGFYRDYSSTGLPIHMRDTAELYSDLNQRTTVAEVKSESDLNSSSMESSRSYKCMKCCKVGPLLIWYYIKLMTNYTLLMTQNCLKFTVRYSPLRTV